MKFTDEEIKKAAESISSIDLNDYDFEEIKMGMKSELEHGTENPELNVTNDDPVKTLEIVLAHLKENKKYYKDLLKYVEKDETSESKERYKLKAFDTYLTEDGDGGMATLGSVQGMGAPVLASRGITGSGDVPSVAIPKKKKKKVKSFDQFLKNI